MKMSRKMTAATVVGLAAVSLFYGGAANASTSPVESLSDAGSAEQVATDLYNELSSSRDPQQTYANFTAEERAAFDGYLLPAEASESYTLTQVDAAGEPVAAAKTFSTESDAMASVAAAQACYVGTSKYTMHAALGNAIWDTWTEGVWCGNGSSVTSANFTKSWTTIAAVGWRDGGQIASGSGIAANQARMWSQRKVILGAGGWDVQTQQPCNRLNGTAGGGASSTWSCSIA